MNNPPLNPIQVTLIDAKGGGVGPLGDLNHSHATAFSSGTCGAATMAR